MANWHQFSFTITLLFAASLSILISYYAWYRRKVPGARYLGMLMLAIAFWSLAYAFEISAQGLENTVFWGAVSYIGIHSVPPAFVMLSLVYSQRTHWLTRRNIILLWIIPVATMLAALTNEYHHLIWTGFSLSDLEPFLVVYHYGPGFTVGTTYAYSLFLLSVINLLWAAIIMPKGYRRRIIAILLASLIPWVVNVAYIFKIDPFPGRDITPITFLLTGIIISWSILRHKLLDLTPIVRSKIVDAISDAVIVVDHQYIISDLNQIAQSIIQIKSSMAIGQSAEKILAHWPSLQARFRSGDDIPTEVKHITDVRGRYYEQRVYPLRENRENVQGWLILLRDITEERELEAALRASEELYRNVTEQANDGIAILQDNAIKYCNPQLADILGLPPEEIVGRPFIEFFPPDQAEIVKERHNRRLRGEKVPSKYETALIHQSGQRVPIEANVSVMELDGNPAVLTIARDIRERLKAESEISRLAAVVTQAGETVIVTNLEGIIEYANPQFELTTGYTVDEALGKNPRILKSGLRDSGFYANLWKTISQGKTWKGNFINKRKDGSFYHEAAVIFPIKDPEETITHYAAVKRDITEEVRAKNELEAYARQQRLLNEITRSGIEAANLEETIHALSSRLIQLLNADYCSILVWERHQKKTTIIARTKTGEQSPQLDTIENKLIEITRETGQHLIIEDLHSTPHFTKEKIQNSLVQSLIALPLIYNEEKLGMVTLAFFHSRQFSLEETLSVEQAINQIALVIRNTQLLETTHQRATEAETLRQAGIAVASTLRLDEAIDRILLQFSRVVPYDSASVQLLKDNELEIVGQHGFENPEAVIGIRFPVHEDNPNSITVDGRKTYIIKDAPLVYDQFRKKPHNHIRGWMGVPLIVQDRLIGMLALDSKHPGKFTNEHARLATAFATQVAIALENARLYEETHRLAIYDGLTNLYSRRYFMNLAQQEYQRACRYQHPLSIIMLDLDHFKTVNDTFGHLAGDQVLRDVAQVCQASLRETDIIGRFGGEEFVILLPETPGIRLGEEKTAEILDSTAKYVAERLRQGVADLIMSSPRGDIRVTISQGIVELTSTDETIDTLLDRADTALYIAKQRGRNQYVVWNE